MNTVYTWIYRGWVTSEKRPGLRFRIILADAAEIQRLRALHDLPHGHHARTRWQAPVPPDTTEGEHKFKGIRGDLGLPQCEVGKPANSRRDQRRYGHERDSCDDLLA